MEQHILLSLMPGENVVGFLWVGPATVSSLEVCRVTTGDDGDVMDLPMQLHRPPLQ